MKTIVNAYQYLVFLGGLLKSPVLLFCRLYWGWLFMEAGYAKLINIEPFVESLQAMGFPLPLFQAYLAGGTEMIGGVCLMLGLAARLASIPLAIVMLTAYSTVHVESLKSILSNPSLFVSEAPFNFLLTTLIILAFGPGRFSLDYLLEKMVFKKA